LEREGIGDLEKALGDCKERMKNIYSSASVITLNLDKLEKMFK